MPDVYKRLAEKTNSYPYPLKSFLLPLKKLQVGIVRFLSF
jgi:hypothetical protein